MTTTWTFAIDWDRNGDFDDTYDDVTSSVLPANWFLEMWQPYKNFANDSISKLVPPNNSQRFSPENASSPLYGRLAPFRPLTAQVPHAYSH